MSAPKAACGLGRTEEASSSPVRKSTRDVAMEVVPKSMASPAAVPEPGEATHGSYGTPDSSRLGAFLARESGVKPARRFEIALAVELDARPVLAPGAAPVGQPGAALVAKPGAALVAKPGTRAGR